MTQDTNFLYWLHHHDEEGMAVVGFVKDECAGGIPLLLLSWQKKKQNSFGSYLSSGFIDVIMFSKVKFGTFVGKESELESTSMVCYMFL